MLEAQGLKYDVVGDGEPVLQIHGALIADTFLPLAREPALAEPYRLIRYRRRGHGGSEPPTRPLHFEQPAQDAEALLDHLGVERAHVVGHSGGGVIAVQLALQAPGRVHSLVLLEPAIMPPEATSLMLQGAAPAVEAYQAGDHGRALDLWMGLVACGPEWRREVGATVPGGPEQAERDCGTFFEVELPALAEGWVFDAERASRISQPLLYLIGGESGPLFESAGKYFQSLVPQTETQVVPGVNHLMQIRDPKAIAAKVADFLSRHPL